MSLPDGVNNFPERLGAIGRERELKPRQHIRPASQDNLYKFHRADKNMSARQLPRSWPALLQ